MFKELCQNKPSVALKAMLDGTEEVYNSKDFEIDLMDYGQIKKKKLAVCMATCAVFKLTGKVYTKDNIEDCYERAKFLGVEYIELFKFQMALSTFVLFGWTLDLNKFFECKLPPIERRWSFVKYNPQDKQLNHIREYITQIEGLDL